MNNQHLEELDRARDRFSKAKAAFTAAAQAGIRGDKDAADKAAIAFREPEGARVELRALTDRAPGLWAIAAQVRDEQR